MNENLVSQVNGLHPAESGSLAIQVEALLRATAAPKLGHAAHEQQAVKTSEQLPAQGSGSAASISLQFRADEQTGKMTIFVVDRASKQVLRSIPASELHKLQAGDLLKLTA